MSIDSVSIFLSATILVIFSLLVIVIGLLIINNLVHKYWKSWGWHFGYLNPFFHSDYNKPYKFVDPSENQQEINKK